MKTITLIANGLQMSNATIKKDKDKTISNKMFDVKVNGRYVGSIDMQDHKLVRLYNDENYYELKEV